jgi:hypothetical protein
MNVAVCIPTRNQSELISDALRSAFAQSVLPVDVVVSDDAGTDDTAAVVERFRATLRPELQSRLRYDRSPAVLGIGGNFDRAVRLAAGELVVKLDSDDLLEPDFIKVLAGRLQANPKAGWAHCNVWNVRPDLTPTALAHTRKPGGFYAAEKALPAYLRHNDTCHCVMLRKSAYLEVGGYQREMKTAEDWLLWLELLFAGWGYVFDAEPLARMRKYEARPELMTRRRQAFVESAHFMAPRIEELCRKNDIAGMSTAVALNRFQSALARLCILSGCDEANPQVRRTLFEAACEIHPSMRSRLWRMVMAPLPTEVTRNLVNLSGMPRGCARKVIQKLRRGPAAGQ